MKKTAILFGAILGLVSFTANAQVTTPGAPQSAQAIVNVKLYPIQTIIVNPTNKIVDLEYKTDTDYADGVNADQADHLTIYSTGAFAVTVKSDSDKLTSTDAGVTADINAGDIYVKASAGTTNALAVSGVTYEPAVSLSQTATKLFSSTLGGVNRTVNVNYAAKGDLNSYVNKYFNVQNPTVYTTTVTYTITAQ